MGRVILSLIYFNEYSEVRVPPAARLYDAEEHHLEDAFPELGRRHAQGSELTSDVGQIQATQSIMDGHSHDRGIVDTECPLLDALLQDAAQDVELAHIEPATGMFQLDDITEELGLERAVADHRIAHLVQTAQDVALQFLVSRYLQRLYLLDGLDDMAHLAIDDRQEDLGLRFEVGIERATAFSRLRSDLVHRCVVETLCGKKLSRHLYEF